MISKDDIIRVQEAAKIEEVVGEFVNLKKRGSNYIGLCPFHNEKTPSFVVSPAKNIYKCFGCGAAGGSFNFIMDHEQFTYPESIRYLAKKYNIEIIETEQTEDDKIAEDEKQIAFLLHELAMRFYNDYLNNSDEGKSVGLSYFRNRGFSDNIIEKFGLGYSSSFEQGFAEYAINKGYKLETIIENGLANNTSYPSDRFRGRVVFPIHSISGRVIGFGARMMSQNDKGPKYLNSPETKIYHKSKVLYGLHLAKKSMVHNDNCFVVEGYTDVISLHQAGVENVVSSSGTSLTEDQIRIIQRYTKNITVVFDGDKAGVMASMRGIDLILAAEMNVRVVMLPENEDPDSFAQKNRDSDVALFFNENAVSFIAFKAKMLFNDAGNDPIKRATAIKEIVASIALINDEITRTLYIRECSVLVDLPEKVLSAEVSKQLRKKIKKQLGDEGNFINDTKDPFTSEKQILEKDISFTYLERRIASLLLNFAKSEISVNYTNSEGVEEQISVAVDAYIINSLLQDELKIKDDFSNKIFQEYESRLNSDDAFDMEIFINSTTDADFRKFIVELITTPYVLSQHWSDELNVFVLTTDNAPDLLKKEISGTISLYKLYRVREVVNELQEKLQNTEDEETQVDLLVKIHTLQHAMREFSKLLGGIVVFDF